MPMETRSKGVYKPGFYLCKAKIIKQNIRPIPRNLSSYRSFIQKINTRILKNLVYRPKKTATVTSSFEISTRDYNSLKQQFYITGRYLYNKEFNNYFQLINKRYDNPSDFCSYQQEQFKIKLSKNKDFSYLDENCKIRKQHQCPKFSFKFLRWYKKDKRA
jgi:hypothetical protein